MIPALRIVSSKVQRSKKRIIGILTIYLRKIYISKKQQTFHRNIHDLVTPFTGFLLSDFFYSEEVEFHNLRWLNPKSKHMKYLKQRKLESPVRIFCQVDQIEQFEKKYLDSVKVPFVLITGKWHLPGFTISDSVFKILRNP